MGVGVTEVGWGGVGGCRWGVQMEAESLALAGGVTFVSLLGSIYLCFDQSQQCCLPPSPHHLHHPSYSRHTLSAPQHVASAPTHPIITAQARFDKGTRRALMG